ncbi:hypothetical protein AAY473_021517 [Plecturocebus cupreus]
MCLVQPEELRDGFRHVDQAGLELLNSGGVLLCHPGWSAVVPSQLTATSASQPLVTKSSDEHSYLQITTGSQRIQSNHWKQTELPFHKSPVRTKVAPMPLGPRRLICLPGRQRGPSPQQVEMGFRHIGQAGLELLTSVCQARFCLRVLTLAIPLVCECHLLIETFPGCLIHNCYPSQHVGAALSRQAGASGPVDPLNARRVLLKAFFDFSECGHQWSILESPRGAVQQQDSQCPIGMEMGCSVCGLTLWHHCPCSDIACFSKGKGATESRALTLGEREWELPSSRPSLQMEEPEESQAECKAERGGRRR